MFTQLPKNGYPPSPGLSPTMPRMVTHDPMNCHPPFPGCSPTLPRMAFHHSLDGRLSSPRFSTAIIRTGIRRMINYYPHDGQWSTTILSMATHHQHSQDGHSPYTGCSAPSQGLSSSIPRMVNATSIHMMVTHHSQDRQPPTVGWSTPISRMVNQKWSLT